MMGPRENKIIVSKKCATNMARWILPEQEWQRLAAQRFDRFLKQEGLRESAFEVEQHERGNDWKDIRERLFGLLCGGLAAACVIVSLSVLLGANRPNQEFTKIPESSALKQTTFTIREIPKVGSKPCLLAIRP